MITSATQTSDSDNNTNTLNQRVKFQVYTLSLLTYAMLYARFACDNLSRSEDWVAPPPGACYPRRELQPLEAVAASSERVPKPPRPALEPQQAPRGEGTSTETNIGRTIPRRLSAADEPVFVFAAAFETPCPQQNSENYVFNVEPNPLGYPSIVYYHIPQDYDQTLLSENLCD